MDAAKRVLVLRWISQQPRIGGRTDGDPLSTSTAVHTAGMRFNKTAVRIYSVLYSLIPRPPRSWIEPEREQERRSWVEETERNADREERFAAAKADGTLTREDKERFAQQRREHRELGVRIGKRGGVGVEGIWWVHWLRQAISAETRASEAFGALTTQGHNTANLLAEFDPSLSAVTASAFAIEALHNDGRFRIPPPQRKRRPTQVQLISYAFETGWEAFDGGAFTPRLKDLFDRRSQGVHAYSEMRPAAPHPAGLNSGWEHEAFNAVEATKAVDLALELVELTDGPLAADLDAPHQLWLQRWANRRKPYRDAVLGEPRSRGPAVS